MIKKITNIIFYFFLPGVAQLISLYAFSQKQFLKFDHLQTNEGLSQSNVLCILQDSRGFMWFGTEDGLNKYNGYNFTAYKNDPQKNNSLSNNFINGIVEDSNGDLLIATWGGGLNKYDRNKNEFIHFKHDINNPNSISSDFITCLLKDSKGNIWLSIDGGGINVFDRKNNRFIKYTTHNSTISDSTITTICEDSQHTIWIGTNNGGLNLFNAGKNSFINFKHNDNEPASLSNNKINALFEDSKHRLWVGTGNGLNLFDKQTGKFRIYNIGNTKFPGLCDDVIFSMAEDNEGMIWIGSENNGISVLNPETETFTNYQYSDFISTDLSSNSINKIYKDTKGNIWIGTYNAGINFIASDANKFTHYKHTSSLNSLTNNNVLSICQDKENNLWIATDGGGLDMYNHTTGNFKHFKHEEGYNTIAGNNVMSVLEDSYGNLWVGTYGNGVSVLNKKQNTWKQYKNDPANPYSIAGNTGWAIYEDSKRNVWITSATNGLSLYNRVNDRFTQYSAEKYGLSGNDVLSIYESKDGYIWLGTYNSGITRLDKKTNKVTTFKYDKNNKKGLGDNTVNCFSEDENGNLWVGTNKGLDCLDRRRNVFTHYGVKDGLPHEKTVGILNDDKGNLWISTGKGLSRFNLKNNTFKNFGVADGLQANEFKQAYYKGHSGIMYFGGNNGFNEFYPDNIKESSFDPPLVITDFRIFNKSVPVANNKNGSSPLKKDIAETNSISIPHSSSVISFEFASLNYTSAEKKQYAYMLQGFDKDWNYIGISHTATYTNLDPGKYIFKVKGLNNNGEWSARTTTIELTITPPFWLTWWFKLCLFALIIGSAFLFYSFRTNTIEAQKRKLQKQVHEQTLQLVHSAKEERKAREAAEKAHFASDKARQEADQANINLERKNKELEQFAYIASHDLQEPLRTTSSFIELLRKQYQGKLDEKADKYFNYILESSDRMKLLIKNLLDYSRIGNKKELEQVDCNKTLQEVLADLGVAINDANADIQHNPLPVVRGYPTEIKQLFQNLIINAVKFQRKGVAPQIKISVHKVKNNWEFAFKDNGIGIEKQHSEKIFNIFQRLHTRAEYEGSGIGLSHCKKIVELHRGRIWVESTFGEGSTFNFTLPTGHEEIIQN